MVSKEVFRYFSFLLMFVFLISFTSAWEFDNCKKYDEEKQEVIIENSFCLGEEIARITLNTPLNNPVGAGYQKVAEFTVNNKEQYEVALKEVKLYDNRIKSHKFDSENRIDKHFDYKYLTYEDIEVEDFINNCSNHTYSNGTIESVCNKVITGTHTETREVWMDLVENLPEGNITIGIFTNVEVGESVEWIPTYFGVDIPEFASWTQSLNVDLISYYKFDEQDTTGSGTIIDSLDLNNGTNNGTSNTTGKILTAYNFNRSVPNYINISDSSSFDFTNKITISAWFNTDNVAHTSAQKIITKDRSGTEREIVLGIKPTTAVELILWDTSDTIHAYTPAYSLSSSTWYHIVGTYDGTTMRIYVDGSEVSTGLADTFNIKNGVRDFVIGTDELTSPNSAFDGKIDEIGIWSRALNQSEITQLYNNGTGISYDEFLGATVEILYPLNTTYTIFISQLNYTNSSDASKCWYTIDGGTTNASAIDCGTNFTGVTSVGGSNTWTVYVNDSLGEENSDTVTFFINKTVQTTLITPQAGSNFTNQLVSFNFTSTPINANLSNATLFVWNETNNNLIATNFTSLSGTIPVITVFTNNLEEGNYKWNAETCGVDVGCEFANSNNSFVVHLTEPHINITAPFGTIDYFKLGDNETLIYNITEPGQNLTEHLEECWFVYGNNQLPFVSNQTLPVGLRNGIYNAQGVSNQNQSYTFLLGDIFNHYLNVTTYNGNDGTLGNTKIRLDECDTSEISLNMTCNTPEFTTYCSTEFKCGIISLDNISTTSPGIGHPTTLSEIEYVEGEVTSLNCTENQTNFTYIQGQNNITVFAKDTFGLIASNASTWDYEILEINQTFEPHAIELSTQDFELLVDVSGTITAVSLVYNGTAHSANIFTNGLTQITSSFQIPTFAVDTNATFYYNITMLSGSTIITQEQTQLVNVLLIGNCTAFSNLLFNLSLFDEKLLTPLEGTIEADIQILNQDGSTGVSEKSTQFHNVSTASICSNINITEENNLYNLELRYYVDPLNNSNFLYVPEFYHIQQAQTSNLPMEINLYDLNVNESTEFTIFYRDNDYIARENVLLQIQRRYVDEGLFRVIEIPITSSEGTAIGHFDLNNYKYKITVTQYGEVLNVFDNPAIRCESELSGICEIHLKGLAEVPQAEFTSDLEDFFYTATQEEDSVEIAYVVPTGESKNIRVVMVQTSPFKDATTICNTTVLSSAGQIICFVNATIGDSNIDITIYSNNEVKSRARAVFQEDLNSAFLLNNYFIAIVLLMTIVMMVVSSPQLMVIASIFGLAFSGLVFLLKYETIGLAAGAMGWLIVVGIIILVKLNKKAEQ